MCRRQDSGYGGGGGQATSGILRGKVHEGLTHFQLHTLVYFWDVFLNTE